LDLYKNAKGGLEIIFLSQKWRIIPLLKKIDVGEM
jgi:hypothetical protein